MKEITKEELIEFIKDNCYISENDPIKIEWGWSEGHGSQSSKIINKKILEILKNEI